MTKSMSRGKFITIEGAEGAGKSSNLDFIQHFLQHAGKRVRRTREPGGTVLSEQIRQLLLQPRDDGMDETAELLLMFAARAEHLAKCIVPALEQGEWVLCDRFTDATDAYQGAGRGLDRTTIRCLEEMVQQGLKPDLTLLLDVPVETGLARANQRSQADRFERENRLFFDRVRAEYLRLAQAEPDRIKRVDAAVPLPQVQDQIRRILARFIAPS
jgi:dTMP kinase